MIKYFNFESFDDQRGQRILPINSSNEMNKTASSGYSTDILNYISKMERRADRYYVVIDAVGSEEVWGSNNNGDGFPREALNHLSLRSDMGTDKDYGYKTFEYYGKLFKHHANKPYHPSFGEVLYAYWNPEMDRVELVVAVDTVSGSDIVEALETGTPVAVSMGAKLPFDECSICGKRARVREEYCKHLTGHLRQVVTHEMSALWSKEMGRQVVPGQKVYAINRYPKFFDISKVRIGADRTAFVMGKAANEGIEHFAADMGDVYGITDRDIDKLAELDKEIGGGIGDVDGWVIPVSQMKESVENAIENDIVRQRDLPDEVLDSLGGYDLKSVINSLIGLGVHPKPREFQRIVLIHIGERDLANKLDSRGVVFNDYDAAPISIGGSIEISQPVMSAVRDSLDERSFLPPFAFKRIHPSVMIKRASLENASGPAVRVPNFSDPMLIMGTIAALYQGMKMKASGLTMNQIATAVSRNPAIMTMIGGGLLAKMYKTMADQQVSVMDIPARNYEGALPKINLIKTAGVAENIAGNTVLAGVIGVPLAAAAKSYNKRAATTGEKQIPVIAEDNRVTPVVTGGAALAAGVLKNKIINAVA